MRSRLEHDLVVLAGGAGRRLGGVDKAELTVGSRRLLDGALAAAPGATRRVVVGPRRETDATVIWCREAPPGGGPVAALAAAWPLCAAPLVVVLAVDLPFADVDTTAALLAAVAGRDGAVAVDDGGRVQPLLAVYRHSALGPVLEMLGSGAGVAVRTVVASLDLARVPLGEATDDCDTPADLARARRLAAHGPSNRAGGGVP